MKYAIISDIHGNSSALYKFINKINRTSPINKVICLGDFSGKNNSTEIKNILLKSLHAIVISGNVDDNSSGLKDAPFIVNNLFAICHGSTQDQEKYLLSISDTKSDFRWLIQNKIKFLFFGHTHIPKIYTYNPKQDLIQNYRGSLFTHEIQLNPNFYYLINPGSLGKPKTNNNGTFCIFDSENLLLSYYRFSVR